MEDLTGEKPREVNFYLPASSVPIFKQLEGFSDFDPIKEIVHCDKPGTGLSDAPRAFRIQLVKELTNLGLQAIRVDNELFMMHEDQSAYGTVARLGRRDQGVPPPPLKEPDAN